MKKKLICLVLVVVLALSFSSNALAASRSLSANSIGTIFFSQVVRGGGVTINQTIAGLNGMYAGTIWHMYSIDGDYTSVTFTGDEGAVPTTKTIFPRSNAVGKSHELQVENCAPFNIILVYTYTIN